MGLFGQGHWPLSLIAFICEIVGLVTGILVTGRRAFSDGNIDGGGNPVLIDNSSGDKETVFVPSYRHLSGYGDTGERIDAFTGSMENSFLVGFKLSVAGLEPVKWSLIGWITQSRKGRLKIGGKRSVSSRCLYPGSRQFTALG